MPIKISVAIATYNGEKYISEQISSILCQLDKDDEIVISDDGSCDNTIQIIEDFNDKRIKILNGPQKGIIKNFENAILNCGGDIIFLCDQDDIWEKTKKTTILKSFEDKKVILVVHDSIMIDESGQKIHDSFFEFRKCKNGKIHNIVKNSFIGCCMAFRKELVSEIMPMPTNIPMHDQWVGLVALENGKVGFIKDKLIKYRRHKDNNSSFKRNSLLKMLKNRFNLINNIHNYRKNQKMSKKAPIDIVLTWVDSNDPKWSAEKSKYTSDKTADSRIIRYRDWDNLKYVFRGIEKFCPFVRKIHFVTYGHIPNWLNTNNPKLNIVKHEDFIPKEYLPTFNVNPIENNFHRINDLSENFVYFNDDNFVLRKMKATDFFEKDLPCDSAIENPIIAGNDNIDYILLNDMEIINKYFNKKSVRKNNFWKWYTPKYGLYLAKTICLTQWKNFTGFRYSHLPSSICKSTMQEVWKREPSKLDKCCKNKFRSRDDVNQFLFTNWQMASGNFCPRSTRIGKFFLASDNNKRLIRVIKKQKYKMICINDSSEIKDFESAKDEINAALDSILHEKSSYEA